MKPVTHSVLQWITELCKHHPSSSYPCMLQSRSCPAVSPISRIRSHRGFSCFILRMSRFSAPRFYPHIPRWRTPADTCTQRGLNTRSLACMSLEPCTVRFVETPEGQFNLSEWRTIQAGFFTSAAVGREDGGRVVRKWTSFLEKSTSSVQSKATRIFFSKRGSFSK